MIAEKEAPNNKINQKENDFDKSDK